jgi:ABC-type transport system involved in cytochrome c biogenesis permease component
MSLRWIRQARAVAEKELWVELRSREALLGSVLFSALAACAVSFAAFVVRPEAPLAAGMIAVVILFSSSSSAPRLFLQEADQGTRDLLRLAARPSAVFAGKLGFASAQSVAASVLAAPLVAVMVQARVANWLEFLAAFGLLGSGSAACLALCGWLASEAKGRWVVAAAAGLPLGLPLVLLGVRAGAYGLGSGDWARASGSLLGLAAYSAAVGWAGIWLAGQSDRPAGGGGGSVSFGERR